MIQDVLVAAGTEGHHSSTALAQAHPVSPAATFEEHGVIGGEFSCEG